MWFDNLINVHSAVQGIVILSLICTLGLALGKIHVKGISLGIAFVFFVGSGIRLAQLANTTPGTT